MLEAIGLALGLAMDATAVSAARGLSAHAREKVILPAMFGGFQSGMAALGWLASTFAGRYIEAYEHWVAFALLLVIGGKMLVEAWRGADDGEEKPGGATVYLGLAIATSIDAAAAGITLPTIPTAPWLSLVLIGGITAACSLVGFLVGRVAGKHLGRRLEILGGVVLIALGTKILVEGL